MSAQAWSDDDRKTLAEMWLAGDSAKTIGRALGRTRNAVLGVVHRTKSLPQRINTVARSHAQKPLKIYKAELLPKKIIPALVLLPADPPIYTIDLEDHHCHFPYDAPDGFSVIYCGRDRKGRTQYCEDHGIQIHQPKTAKDLKNAS